MYCPSCSTSNVPKALTCRGCGAPLHAATAAPASAPDHLAVGTKLQGGRFTVGKAMRRRESDVIYLGGDAQGQRLTLIQELFPSGSVRRDGTVLPANDVATAAFNGAKRQFLQEAKHLRGLNHPGLVRTVAVFEEHNTVYLVQERPAGVSVADTLSARGRPYAEAEATEVVLKLADALATLHSTGLAHRDLTPDNVWLHSDRVLLGGVLLGMDAMPDHRVGTTPPISRYAAPEHHIPQTRLTPRADVYGLAAILYHLLTGAAPIAASARAKGVPLKAVRQLNPQASARIAQLVMKGLAMEARHRPATALEFWQQLRELAATPAYEVPPVPATPPVRVPSPPTPPPTPPVVPPTPQPTDVVHAVLMGRAPLAAPTADIGPAPAPLAIVPPAFRPTAGTLHPLPGHSGRVAAVAFSPVGGQLASGGEEGACILWDARLGTLLRVMPESLQQLGTTLRDAVPSTLNETLALAQTVGRTVKGTVRGQECRVNAVAFSPDGRLLAAANEDGTVVLWNTTTGTIQQTLKGHLGRVVAVAFAPDGHLLASAGHDSAVMLWDAVSGKSTLRLTDYHGVSSLAFAPDGKLLATGSTENGVLLWQVPSGKVLRNLRAPGHEVTAVAFSPTNRMLASAGYDKVAHLWDVELDQPLWTLSGHRGALTSVAFSPDGATVATGGYDKTVRLWDALSGEFRFTLTEHEAAVNAVAYAPDGRRLAAGAGAQVCLWHLS